MLAALLVEASNGFCGGSRVGISPQIAVMFRCYWFLNKLQAHKSLKVLASRSDQRVTGSLGQYCCRVQTACSVCYLLDGLDG